MIRSVLWPAPRAASSLRLPYARVGVRSLSQKVHTILSPHEKIDIPDMPLPSMILDRCKLFGTLPAIHCGVSGRSLSYNDVALSIRATASKLQANGVKKGDVVGLYAYNLPEYAIAFHGASLAGATVCTYSPLYTPEEVDRQIRDSNTKYLVTVPQLAPNVKAAVELSGRKELLSNTFCFDESVMGATVPEGLRAFSELSAIPNGISKPDEIEVQPVNFDVHKDVAAILYSSGTTGLPKGVMLSHYNLVANLLQCATVEQLSPDDHLVGVLPLFHIYGKMLIECVALYHGATVTMMPKFDLEMFLRVLQDYKVTCAHIAPPVLVPMAKHPSVANYDLSNLKYFFSGAAPLSSELEVLVKKRLPHVEIKQAYGMTELSPACHITPNNKIKSGSIGPLVANTESQIRNVATGETVGANQEGEICIRGPQVMLGYLNRPDATAETIGKDGYLRTGDIGYVDDDGYFFIVDRVKELIKVKGYQVAPAELEAILLKHPAIADAAVVPKPDDFSGELPVAFIVRSKDHEVPDLDILKHVAEHVAPYKRIHEIRHVDEIPKSAAGKILRKILKEQLRQEHAQKHKRMA